MNKVVLVGRLTRDPEIRHTQSGAAVASFSLAVSRRKKDEADFVPVTAWNKTAELVEKYVKKGDRVGIAGRIQTGSYEKDGRKVYTFDVIADDLEFLSTKAEREEPEQQTFTADSDGFLKVPEKLDDELPFR